MPIVDMDKFIDEVQARPEIYYSSDPHYYSQRKDKLKELGSLFDMI